MRASMPFGLSFAAGSAVSVFVGGPLEPAR